MDLVRAPCAEASADEGSEDATQQIDLDNQKIRLACSLLLKENFFDIIQAHQPNQDKSFDCKCALN